MYPKTMILALLMVAASAKADITVTGWELAIIARDDFRPDVVVIETAPPVTLPFNVVSTATAGPSEATSTYAFDVVVPILQSRRPSNADVPFENNFAERQIRPAVILRKNSQSNRSDRGVATQAILMSVYRTLRLRGLNPTKTIADALRTYLATGKLPPVPNTDIADG